MAERRSKHQAVTVRLPVGSLSINTFCQVAHTLFTGQYNFVSAKGGDALWTAGKVAVGLALHCHVSQT